METLPLTSNVNFDIPGFSRRSTVVADDGGRWTNFGNTVTFHYSVMYRFCYALDCMNAMYPAGDPHRKRNFFYQKIFHILYFLEPLFFLALLCESAFVYGGESKGIMIAYSVIFFIFGLIYTGLYAFQLPEVFRTSIQSSNWIFYPVDLFRDENGHMMNNLLYQYTRNVSVAHTETTNDSASGYFISATGELRVMFYGKNWRNKFMLSYRLWFCLLICFWILGTIGIPILVFSGPVEL